MKYLNWLLLVLALFRPSLVFSYDDKYVHPTINENATLQSKLETVLDLLGIPEGLDKNYSGLGGRFSVKEWFRQGGTDEDNNPRYVRHFHDPLKPWDEAGLTLTLPDSQSSIIWAQNLIQNYSWQNARHAYKTALMTGSEAEFAETFYTLGHLMHLISDMAVPAHVRDDSHPFPQNYPVPDSWKSDPYEKWAANNYDNPEKITYSGYSVELSSLNNYVSDGSDHNLAPIPISALWDQNVYEGQNPDPEITWISNVGLAEFTNANFYSQDTTASIDYNHPDNLSAYIEYDPKNPDPVTAEDNKTDTPVYIYRRVNSNKRYRLAALDYFSMDIGGSVLSGYKKTLDENVFQDYANELIPRAVGYSAALLDYFFRGTIEISMPEADVYSIISDPDAIVDPTTEGFDQIKFRIINTSPPGEEMNDGTLTLVLKYRVTLEDQLVNNPPDPEPEFRYTVKEFANTTVPRDVPDEYTIDLSDSPIPLWATDLYLYVIYKGRLGQENDAVAVGFKDISEPTPVDIFNATDMPCVNGVKYPAYTAISVADDPEWDGFPHDIRDAYVLFSPKDMPLVLQRPISQNFFSYHVDTITPGDYDRKYILSDYTINMSRTLGWNGSIDPDDNFTHPEHDIDFVEFNAIKNQMEGPVRWLPTENFFSSYNNITFYNGYFNVNQYGIGDCTYWY